MKYEFADDLKRILAKLAKKDPESCKAVKNKVEEIVNSGNVDHYKPLKYDLKNLKAVHVRKSFVLVFEYDHANDTIWFLDYDHHDLIYRKRFK